MNFTLPNCVLACVSAILAPLALAQSTAGVSGHWEGSIHIPNNDLAIRVDLAKNAKGEWIGAIDIPAQNAKGFPLSSISVNGNSAKFVMKGPPGDPSFDGTLSADGKSMSGKFIQGEAALDFEFKRMGDAKIEAPAKSTAIAKELEGTWAGAVEINGTRLRLLLKMANQPDGAAAGSLVSLDQEGSEIPVTTITQNASNLKVEIKSIGGSFEGDQKEGALVGQWSQSGGSWPLTFKRQPK